MIRPFLCTVMHQTLKIAIIGDYNFTYNAHQATNLAIDHAARFLEVDINYYWIKTNEAAQFKPSQFEQFDGIWVAPGPYQNAFFLIGIIRNLSQMKIPVLLTGESHRHFIEGCAAAQPGEEDRHPLLWWNEAEAELPLPAWPRGVAGHGSPARFPSLPAQLPIHSAPVPVIQPVEG